MSGGYSQGVVKTGVSGGYSQGVVKTGVSGGYKARGGKDWSVRWV